MTFDGHDDDFIPAPTRPGCIRPKLAGTPDMGQVESIADLLEDQRLVEANRHNIDGDLEVFASEGGCKVFGWASKGFRFGTTAAAAVFIWRYLGLSLPERAVQLVLETVRQRHLQA